MKLLGIHVHAKLKILVLSMMLLTSSAHATSLNPGALIEDLITAIFGGGQLQTLVENVGILYADTNPGIGLVLNALGIHDAAELNNFLENDLTASNFKGVLTHLAYNYALSDASLSNWLSLAGITNEAQLGVFLNSPNGSTFATYFYQLALNYAQSNPTYSAWLNALDIKNFSDVEAILAGDLNTSNLGNNLMGLGLSYLGSNWMLSGYLPWVQWILGDNVSATNLFAPFLGAFQGLPLSDIQTIVSATQIK